MPKARLRAVSHEERIPLVDHLDELRWRIIISIGALVVTAGIAFGLEERLLDLAYRPLPDDRVPTTFGVGEPFLTTLTVAV
jgi:Sec-independent protein secretion pathway component TatC